jgi:subtilisin-like proprotein convertase family protein
MFTRIVTIMLIAVLALPAAQLTRPAQTSPSSWNDVAVAAKGKKHQNAKKGNSKVRTRTIRRPVTRTFTSTAPIAIPNDAASTDNGKADPYPTTIAVSGFANGTITDVNLILTDLTHTHHDDLDVLLSAGDGRRALVMSDTGDSSDTANIDLVLDDEAVAAMPGEGEELNSGTYRPTNLVVTDDPFDAPAPTPNGNVALSTFDGANPSGTWQLWVMDNGAGDDGNLDGWALQITAEVDVKVKSHNKKGKKRH